MPVQREDRPAVDQVAQADVDELREEAFKRGIKMGASTDDQALRQVLAAIGDVDLAATALTLHPRPPWLRGLIGAKLPVDHAAVR